MYNYSQPGIQAHIRTARSETSLTRLKMAIILPTGQWYAPSAVINDTWYCMVLHGTALYCTVLISTTWYYMALHGIKWY